MATFRLEKVLSHRRTLETLAQQAMAQAIQDEQELQRQLSKLRDCLSACAAEFAEGKQEGLAPDELLLYQAHLDRLSDQVAALRQRCLEAAQEVELRREALVAASMAKQLLEKLKEKQAAELNAELLHQENNLLDEIAIQKFQKR